MSCPTCSCTMQNLGLDAGPELDIRVFWCPRCGTLRREVGEWSTNDVPKLVGCCRKFGETLGPSWGKLWQTLGIATSINKPGERA